MNESGAKARAFCASRVAPRVDPVPEAYASRTGFFHFIRKDYIVLKRKSITFPMDAHFALKEIWLLLQPRSGAGVRCSAHFCGKCLVRRMWLWNILKE